MLMMLLQVQKPWNVCVKALRSLPLSFATEADLSEVSDEDRVELMEELSLEEPGLHQYDSS